jgi:hypothetical protein
MRSDACTRPRSCVSPATTFRLPSLRSRHRLHHRSTLVRGQFGVSSLRLRAKHRTNRSASCKHFNLCVKNYLCLAGALISNPPIQVFTRPPTSCPREMVSQDHCQARNHCHCNQRQSREFSMARPFLRPKRLERRGLPRSLSTTDLPHTGIDIAAAAAAYVGDLEHIAGRIHNHCQVGSPLHLCSQSG